MNFVRLLFSFTSILKIRTGIFAKLLSSIVLIYGFLSSHKRYTIISYFGQELKQLEMVLPSYTSPSVYYIMYLQITSYSCSVNGYSLK